jgi:lipopolysaccharide/colanic/teichoic acid biosynthesis glycosyltransferase
MKRLLDIVLCLLVLPVVVVILLICIVAIKLDSAGPVFFVQQRTGRGGRRFPMLKLRTMQEGAEQLKEKYSHLNQLSFPDFKIVNDPRITRVGRILRKTSLDELPQLYNVLRGDMSLVGPRPTSFRAESYRLWHTARLEVEPGLTGLWQISGRNELDFDDRLRLDIAYIRNRSLSLDVRILLRTVAAVASGRGAN